MHITHGRVLVQNRKSRDCLLWKPYRNPVASSLETVSRSGGCLLCKPYRNSNKKTVAHLEQPFHVTSYFSIICKVGFTIWSHAATEVCLTAISLMPMFSIIFLGGKGRVRISLELICFDFDTMEMYLS